MSGKKNCTNWLISKFPKISNLFPRRKSRRRFLSRQFPAVSVCKAQPLESRLLLAADGALEIQIMAAPNWIVDSNIESPAGLSPEAAYLAVHITNNGTTDLNDVFVRFGDYQRTFLTSAAGTAPATGIAANRITFEPNPGTTHNVGTLAPGETVTQYWYVSYPLLDAMGRSVAGNKAKQGDDLVLLYDVWATADVGGMDLLAIADDNTATLRSEITAMANKIWPNTTSKVPKEILNAFEQQLGWKDGISPGGDGTIQANGVWYDFGNVNQGFDNNADFVPDSNPHLQWLTHDSMVV